MQKETTLTLSLNNGVKATLDFLSCATDNGKHAVMLSNEELAQKTDTPFSTIKRHLSKLEELGLIELKTEFKHEYGKRCRSINVIPPKSKEQECKSDELPSLEQYQADLLDLKSQLEQEISDVALSDAKQLTEFASFCVLPGTENDRLEAWDFRFKFALLDAINTQIETGEHCDLLTLGPSHLKSYFVNFNKSIDFIDTCLARTKSENPGFSFSGSSYDDVDACPEFQMALQESLTEAQYALKSLPQFQHGFELLPEKVSFELNERTCTVSKGLWAYMCNHQVQPFNKSTPNYNFEYVFNAIRSLHGYDLTPEHYYSVLEQISKDCSNSKVAGMTNLKAKTEAHLRCANGYLAELLMLSARAHEVNFPVKSSLSQTGIFRPVLKNEGKDFINQNGLNKVEANYLSHVVSGVNKNINNLISTYSTGSSFWHLSLGLYDLSSFARQYSYGRMVPASCLKFDFRTLRLDLSNYVSDTDITPDPRAIGISDDQGASLYFDNLGVPGVSSVPGMQALGGSNGVGNPGGPSVPGIGGSSGSDDQGHELKVKGLNLRQWAEVMWFDMAYRLFVMPEQLIFGKLKALKPDLSNLEQWILSSQGLRPGVVKDLYSFCYPEKDIELFVYQVKKAFRNGAHSGQQFVLAWVSRGLTQVCTEHLTPLMFVTTDEDELLPYNSDKPIFTSIVVRYARNFFKVLNPAFGSPDTTSSRSYSDNHLQETPEIFENILSMNDHMVFNEVPFMVLKNQAMFMLQNENIGMWRTKLCGCSAAQYLYALANRPQDKVLWQTINRSYISQEVSFHEL